MAADFFRLANALRKLAAVPSVVARDAAAEITELLLDQYAAGADPRGNRWKALAPSTIAKGRKPPPGTETFAMRDSTRAMPGSGAGILLSVGPAYASYYDAVRNIFPRDGLPPSWREAIRKALEARTHKAVADG